MSFRMAAYTHAHTHTHTNTHTHTLTSTMLFNSKQGCHNMPFIACITHTKRGKIT